MGTCGAVPRRLHASRVAASRAIGGAFGSARTFIAPEFFARGFFICHAEAQANRHLPLAIRAAFAILSSSGTRRERPDVGARAITAPRPSSASRISECVLLQVEASYRTAVPLRAESSAPHGPLRRLARLHSIQPLGLRLRGPVPGRRRTRDPAMVRTAPIPPAMRWRSQ